jgi:hypothetical protein
MDSVGRSRIAVRLGSEGIHGGEAREGFFCLLVFLLVSSPSLANERFFSLREFLFLTFTERHIRGEDVGTALLLRVRSRGPEEALSGARRGG